MIDKPWSPDKVHPLISSSLRLLVLCLVCSELFVIYYCLFLFSKNPFLSLAPFTNATPAFSTLSVNFLMHKGPLSSSETTNFRPFQTERV